MTRPIKFRAWDKENGKMVAPSSISFGDDGSVLTTLINFKFRVKTDTSDDTFDRYLVEGESGILMQFTGLLDKNGKEIYEGDVVSMRGGSVFVVRFDEVTAQFGLGASMESGGVILINSGKDEVIGNIYENPIK
jgi:uncharacterized phage protein (TIGR01671 family)